MKNAILMVMVLCSLCKARTLSEIDSNCIIRYTFDDNNENNKIIDNKRISDGTLYGNGNWYLTDSGTLLEDFENLNDWIISGGSKNIDNTVHKTGSGSLKLTSNPGATCYAVKTINLNVSRYGCGYWFYAEDANKINTVQILFSSTSNLYKFLAYSCSTVATCSEVYSEVKTGWNFVPINVTDWMITNGDSFSNTMIRMRVLVSAKPGQVAVVYFDSFYSGIATRPKCIITFDDNRKSAYSIAYPMMAAYGFRGSCYVIGAKVGYNSTYMNLSDLTELYNAGWDICNHTYNHPVLTGLSEAYQEREIRDGASYLLNNGFTRNNMYNYLAYPGGNFNSDTLTACKNLNVITARLAFPNGLFNFKVYNFIDTYQVTSSTVQYDTEVNVLKNYIDTAITSRQSVCFFLHNITNDVVTGGNWPPANFQAVLNYLNEKRDKIDVVPMTEWYTGMTMTQSNNHSVLGKTGLALSFNGTGNSINSNNTFQNTIRDNSTFCIWVNPANGHPSLPQYLIDANAVDNRISLKLNTDGSLTYLIKANGNVADVTTCEIFNAGPVSTFKLITCTANQTDSTHIALAIYVDDILSAQNDNQVCTLSDYTTTNTLKIGSDFSGIAGFYAGSMDDFRIYNCSLQPMEIKALYSGVEGFLSIDPNFFNCWLSDNVECQQYNFINDEIVNFRDYAEFLK